MRNLPFKAFCCTICYASASIGFCWCDAGGCWCGTILSLLSLRPCTGSGEDLLLSKLLVAVAFCLSEHGFVGASGSSSLWRLFASMANNELQRETNRVQLMIG